MEYRGRWAKPEKKKRCRGHLEEYNRRGDERGPRLEAAGADRLGQRRQALLLRELRAGEGLLFRSTGLSEARGGGRGGVRIAKVFSIARSERFELSTQRISDRSLRDLSEIHGVESAKNQMNIAEIQRTSEKLNRMTCRHSDDTK